MKKKLIFSLFALISSLTFAQTWSDDVAQITYNKCSKCHHQGGIAPFSLMNYSDVVSNALAIQDAITTGIMPPYPPNESYQQYTHSKALNSSEKSIFLSWLTNGTPEGNAANTPPPPVFAGGTILGEGDLQVKIPVYRSKALPGQDDYACFSVPSGLTENRIIKWVEIIPGNIEIVHHALIFIDPDGAELTDTIGGDCTSPANTSTKLIAAYIPGSSPQMMPSQDPLKLGFSMPANSNVYFAMHYPEGSNGMTDSTKVIFHFYPPGETGVREVYADPIIENWNFTLPPNQITTVNGAFNGVTSDMSILSVFPHMHLLGKEIRSYGVKPNNDTIPFIHIPEWDFHWQGFYFFRNILHVPTGTIMRAKGTYDNTVNNPDNPHNPPITAYPGLNTSDEMFLVYFHYLPYQTGDENYDLETLMNHEFAGISQHQNADFSIYPNPFDNSTKIVLDDLKKGGQVSISIYNNQGQMIKTLCKNATGQEFLWNGTDDSGQTVARGIYHISINLDGKFSSRPVIRR